MILSLTEFEFLATWHTVFDLSADKTHTIQIHHGRREVWNRKSLFGIIDSLNDPYIKKVSSLNVLLTFQKSQVRGNWGKKIYIRHDPPIF